MNLAKVCISHHYIVDLDNADMVEEAKNALYEDIMNSVKYNELFSHIDVITQEDSNKWADTDIPEFLNGRDRDWDAAT